jgi:methyltransferase-like protein
LLDFLAQSARQDGGAYSTLLRTELEALRHQADHYLYHEHLEDVNEPLYFHQFAERALATGLRYLGEARLTTMVTGNFTHSVQKALETVAEDQIQAEQYMDFVRNRTFRETLLVHADAAPNWAIQPEAIHRLHVGLSSKLDDSAADIHSDKRLEYRSASGVTLSTSSPAMKAAMRALARQWPGTLSFQELVEAVNQLLGPRDEWVNALAIGLLNTYITADLLDFHSVPIPPAPSLEKPQALPSIRTRMALGQTLAATRRHLLFRSSEYDRLLLPLLDGSRDRGELLDELARLAQSGKLTVQSGGQTLTDPAAIREALGPGLDETLKSYATSSLLQG